MSIRSLLPLLLEVSVFLLVPAFGHCTEIRVLTDRTETHLRNIFTEFENLSGHKVAAIFMDDGLNQRLEAQPLAADLVITKNAELLELAKKKGLLAPLDSEMILKSIDSRFIDPDGNYFVDAYRGRVILYSKKRVQRKELSSYLDLKNPKWKGKLCLRSGFHEYNLGLFSEFLISFGPEKTKDLIQGIHKNLARAPSGNDREQAKMILEGKCDISVINTYYHPIMTTNPDQRSWAEATDLFFPDQKGEGIFIMRSGAALTKGKNQKAARELLEFLASVNGQTKMVDNTFQYPTNKQVEAHPLIKKLSQEQGIANGDLKVNFVPLKKMIEAREQIQKILTEISFDKK